MKINRYQMAISLEIQDAEFFKGRIFNPVSLMAAPFMPALAISGAAGYILILVTLLDFFCSRPTALCFKYFKGFRKLYVSIFSAILLFVIALEFVNDLYKGVLLIVGPIGWFFWIKYSWGCWQRLYLSANSNE